MSTTLDKQVLKRTTGLLADIDLALAAPTLAQRVERTLSSAAPNLDYITQTVEWGVDEASGTIPVPDFASVRDDRGVLIVHNCDCLVDEVTGRRDCYDADPERDEPFRWRRAPFSTSAPGNAPYGCGVDGCGCEAFMGPFEKRHFMGHPCPYTPTPGFADDDPGIKFIDQEGA